MSQFLLIRWTKQGGEIAEVSKIRFEKQGNELFDWLEKEILMRKAKIFHRLSLMAVLIAVTDEWKLEILLRSQRFHKNYFQKLTAFLN